MATLGGTVPSLRPEYLKMPCAQCNGNKVITVRTDLPKVWSRSINAGWPRPWAHLTTKQVPCPSCQLTSNDLHARYKRLLLQSLEKQVNPPLVVGTDWGTEPGYAQWFKLHACDPKLDKQAVVREYLDRLGADVATDLFYGTRKHTQEQFSGLSPLMPRIIFYSQEGRMSKSKSDKPKVLTTWFCLGCRAIGVIAQPKQSAAKLADQIKSYHHSASQGKCTAAPGKLVPKDIKEDRVFCYATAEAELRASNLEKDNQLSEYVKHLDAIQRIAEGRILSTEVVHPTGALMEVRRLRVAHDELKRKAGILLTTIKLSDDVAKHAAELRLKRDMRATDVSVLLTTTEKPLVNTAVTCAPRDQYDPFKV